MATYKMSPCKDCKDRCVGCHGKCVLFKEWKDEESRLHKMVAAKAYIGGVGHYHG